MKERQNKKTKKREKDESSFVKRKHSDEKMQSKNAGKRKQGAVKQSMNQTETQGTKFKRMKTVSSSPNVDQLEKQSRKRKRSKERQNGKELKEKPCTYDREKDCGSPAVKKLKEQAGPELTRKQKRNRKKNSSKKNKYKHLALNNKSSAQGNGASTSLCTAADDKDLNMKQSAVEPVTKLVTQADLSMAASSERPASAEQKVPKSQGSVSSAETPEASPKRKKKRKSKLQKVKESKKYTNLSSHTVTRNIPESDDDADDDDADDDDSVQETSDIENNDSHDRLRAVDRSEPTETVSSSSQKERSSNKPKAASALDKAREKLNAARFRFLNEQLYTSTGAEAFKLFHEDPEAFQVYHQGFQHQVTQWPVNPLDVIIKQIRQMPETTVVADFGCGDARLSESLPQNVVHSFDLVSTKPCVTACDIAKVPLEKSSVNVAVFCLSLMGTNLSDYLCEANRVLLKGGQLKISEVVSRFFSIGRFVKNVESLGFQLQKKVFLDKMFMLFTFKKVKDSSRKHAPRIQLKACLYKRR
ncbi:uncharacterized protein LOC143298783 [Babylonia areolata]|uniref:uncharacterized protein LOC143298783 n=1 Tax=Babylonia areolata TaxID=304850 RepID=UPI003FD65737